MARYAWSGKMIAEVSGREDEVARNTIRQG